MAAAAVVLVLGSGYVAVPPLRAAVDDVAGTFSGWLDGVGGAVPGRPLGAHEQAPDYFRDPSLTADPRVIAQAGGYKLYAAREADGDRIDFDLGDTGAACGPSSKRHERAWASNRLTRQRTSDDDAVPGI